MGMPTGLPPGRRPRGCSRHRPIRPASPRPSGRGRQWSCTGWRNAGAAFAAAEEASRGRAAGWHHRTGDQSPSAAHPRYATGCARGSCRRPTRPPPTNKRPPIALATPSDASWNSFTPRPEASFPLYGAILRMSMRDGTNPHAGRLAGTHHPLRLIRPRMADGMSWRGRMRSTAPSFTASLGMP